MTLLRHTLILLLVAMATVPARGQEYALNNITLEDGLPSNTIYSLYQDQKGFVWVGTENGLARFDGANFKMFPSDGVRSLAISDLQEDGNGDIWMINFYGQVLYLKQDTLRALTPWDRLGYSGFPMIKAIGDTLYITQRNKGIYSYVVSQDTLIQNRPAQQGEDYFTMEGNDEIWRTIGANAIEQTIPYHAGNITLPVNKVSGRLSASEYRQGYYFLNPREGEIFYFGSETDRPLTAKVLDSIPKMRSLKSLGNLGPAVIGPDGLFLLDSSMTNHWVLPGGNVSATTALHEGGILLGTLDRGLYLLPSLKTRQVPPAREKGYHRVTFDSTSQLILAGDLNGNVHLYTPEGQFVRSLLAPPTSSSEIKAIIVNHLRQELWVAGAKLFIYSLGDFLFKEELTIPTIKDIVQIGDQFFMATSTGIFVVNQQLDIQRIGEFNRNSTVARLSDSLLVVGSQAGLNFLNHHTLSFAAPQEPYASQLKGISKVQEIGPYFVAGTTENGLFIYQNDSLVAHLQESPWGLPSNRIIALDGGNRHLAVGTDRGVCLIDVNSWQVHRLDRTNGLRSREVSDVQITPNRLWVTHADGLQYFELPLPQQQIVPQLFLDGLQLDGKPHIHQDLGSVKLPYAFGEFQLTLAVGDAIHTMGKGKIFYRLAELNRGRWNETPIANPTASYLSLPPGKYTFQAYVSTGKGLQSNTLSQTFIVATPYWQQLWFQLLLFAAVSGLAAWLGISKVRRQNAKRQEELLQKNRAQELRISQLTSIRAQMNPHFIFNTMSLIQGLVIQGEIKTAERTIQDFSKLMRSVLEVSSEELVTLADELSVLKRYLAIEKRRFGGDLEYTVAMDDELIPEAVQIPSLLTQPFVENALRHGLLHKEGDKVLAISFQLENSSVLIHIEDNGIGRAAAANLRKNHKRSSFAINAYKKRLALLNATRQDPITLDIEDLVTAQGKPCGTRVSLKIPLDL